MTTHTPNPTRMAARTPEDLLAMVPVVLGFEPEESLTMLCFVGAQCFHARLDLPPESAHAEAAQVLLDAVVTHRVSTVALISHTTCDAGGFAVALERRLRELRVHVFDNLIADGSRWWRSDAPAKAHGVPYDVSAHPFVLQAILNGAVVHRSRADLAASIDVDPRLVAEVEACAGSLSSGDAGLPWAQAVVRRRTAQRQPPTAAEVAHLLDCLEHADAVAAFAAAVARPVDPHLQFWTHVVRATPPHRLLGPASLLALSAWLSGNGALAWCALDRIPVLATDSQLPRAVRNALERAIPPGAWWQAKADDPA